MSGRRDNGEKAAIYFNAAGIANALGADWDNVSRNLFAASAEGLSQRTTLDDGRSVPVGALGFSLPELRGPLVQWESRNNRLVLHCLGQIETEIALAREKYGPSRLAVVIGTSTSGIRRSEDALSYREETGRWPDDYRFARQELGDTAAFAAAVIGAEGPSFSVSTACTSGAKALASAARLLRSGLCDAVVAGGVDTLCRLTLNGFSVLDSVSDERCNAFSVNRKGINLGEGGALFLLTREEAALRLAGYGESVDAHHMSAPDPKGGGARLAITRALESAGITSSDISYVNLHGTATRLNDAMEALVTNEIFGPDAPCSSTKTLTGHLLGAAGSTEAAFVAMALESGLAPPQIWDGENDPALPKLRLVDEVGTPAGGAFMMSCSYAFGGNNTALILAR
ncbi:beta-ketoacyl-ACP synthase [Parvibaculum sp.]|uniref:beta-ketoacyl-ACP synthase n=1 Tax=Parvibaculum sp. TaxID=2024848 RepID=UPI000C8A379A|nr:beta-ketoacyl-ACP synthase [Parvibaculum sp.]MAB14644.1 beta-ketoacyl-[acyl-carrier-protein] synthase II [Parvibaculum sp.]